MSDRLYGIVGRFDDVETVGAAARRAREAGYTEVETYSPFPVHSVSGALGHGGAAIALMAVAAALVGASLQYAAQYWMNVIDYPINVGGRPLHSWPAFIPATVIVGILWASAAALVGMLALCRLPRLHHPLFSVDGFERATMDRFFLCIAASDPRFERQATASLLARLGATEVREVPE